MSFVTAPSMAEFQALWNSTLAEWAVVLRRTDAITAGSGRAGTWAAVLPAGVHAAVLDSGAPQTISGGLTQPAAPSVLTATVSGTLANVTAVALAITGTDSGGAVQTETLPAFPLPGPGQRCTVNGAKVFGSVTSYVQPACGSGVSIALGLAVPARRVPNRFRATEAEAAGRLAAVAPFSVNFSAVVEAAQRPGAADRVLFSDGTLYEIRGSTGPRTEDYGLRLDAERVA